MAMIAAEGQLEEALVTKLQDLKYEYRPDTLTDLSITTERLASIFARRAENVCRFLDFHGRLSSWKRVRRLYGTYTFSRWYFQLRKISSWPDFRLPQSASFLIVTVGMKRRPIFSTMVTTGANS
jgi:hypothetical protein